MRIVPRSGGLLILFLLAMQSFPVAGFAALPERLVLLLDGVSYRDMKALQEGVTYTNSSGQSFHRQAFNQGYFRSAAIFPRFHPPATWLGRKCSGIVRCWVISGLI